MMCMSAAVAPDRPGTLAVLKLCCSWDRSVNGWIVAMPITCRQSITGNSDGVLLLRTCGVSPTAATKCTRDRACGFDTGRQQGLSWGREAIVGHGRIQKTDCLIEASSV